MPSKGSKPSASAAKKSPAKKAASKATAKKAVVKKAVVKKAPAKALKKKAAPPPAPAKKKAAKQPAAAKPATKKAPPTPKPPVKKPPMKQTTKPAAAPAKRTKAPVLDKFLLEQVALLEEERRIYTEQAESLKAEADQLAQEMEPGDIQFDEESGEGGTMNIDRERDLALSAQARAAVEEIDHAMVKVRNGTYGACENCGQPIPKARLKALPYARLCVACKSGGLSRR